MKKSYLLFLSLLLLSITALASVTKDSTFVETLIVLETKTGQIHETLFYPKAICRVPKAVNTTEFA